MLAQFASLWGAVPVDSAPTLAGAPSARREASMSLQSEAGSNSDDDGFECTVCIDDVRTIEGCIWQCREGHLFCAKCYERLGGNGVPCPSCQVPLSNIRSRLAEWQRAKLQKVQTGRAQLRTGSVANPVDDDAARGALLAQSHQEIEGLQPIGRDSPRSLEAIAQPESQEEMMMMPRESLEEMRQTNELAEQIPHSDVQQMPFACAEQVVEVDPDAAGTKKKKKRRPKKQSEILLDFATLGKPIRSEANDKSADRLGGGGGNGGKAGKGGGGSSGGVPVAKAKMKEVSTEKRLKTPTTETAAAAGQHVRDKKPPKFPGECCGNAECRKPLLMPLRCAQCRTVAYCTKECQTKAWKAGHKRECKALACVQIAQMSVLRGGAAGEEPGAAGGAQISLGAGPIPIPDFGFCLNCSGQGIPFFCQKCQKMKCITCDLVSCCGACNKIVCADCEFMGFCDICHKMVCIDCEPMDFCEKCCRSACLDCEPMSWCETCAQSTCMACNPMDLCDTCGKIYQF